MDNKNITIALGFGTHGTKVMSSWTPNTLLNGYPLIGDTKRDDKCFAAFAFSSYTNDGYFVISFIFDDFVRVKPIVKPGNIVSTAPFDWI